jgi:hypothetical protein
MKSARLRERLVRLASAGGQIREMRSVKDLPVSPRSSVLANHRRLFARAQALGSGALSLSSLAKGKFQRILAGLRRINPVSAHRLGTESQHFSQQAYTDELEFCE